MKAIEINEEFLISPFKSGIQLVSPSYSLENSLTSVKKIFSLPFYTYFFANDGATLLDINEFNVEACGYSSKKSLIGKSPADFLEKMTAKKIIENGIEIIKNERFLIFDETLHRLNDDIDFPAFSFKCPFYYKSNNLPGIFGISVLISNLQSNTLLDLYNLFQKLYLLTEFNKFPFEYFFSQKFPYIAYLTRQEKLCLRLTLKGSTAKMIARKLNISFRTVECHLSHIKLKLGVKSKSELIEKIMDSIFN